MFFADESVTHPPSPVACVLSTDGSLLLYHCINRLSGADLNVIIPPQPINLATIKLQPPADQLSQPQTTTNQATELSAPTNQATGSSASTTQATGFVASTNQAVDSATLAPPPSYKPPAVGNQTPSAFTSLLQPTAAVSPKPPVSGFGMPSPGNQQVGY